MSFSSQLRFLPFFLCHFAMIILLLPLVTFSGGDFLHCQLYDATFSPQSGGLSKCLSLCTRGLGLWDFADWTPLADPVYIVLTRWASTSSSGQNDFPDLSHPHLPFNLLLSNSASYISPQTLSTTAAPPNSPTRVPPSPSTQLVGQPGGSTHVCKA